MYCPGNDLNDLEKRSPCPLVSKTVFSGTAH
jgi:hypothetical protein